MQVAVKAGIQKREINSILYELDEPDIAVWFGHPFDKFNQKGQRKRWYRWYPMTDEQVAKFYDDRAWFESL